MPGVWVRSRAAAVCGTLLIQLSAVLFSVVLQGVSAMPAAADIYLKRDRFGVMHFTNVPTDKSYRVMMREPSSVTYHSGLGIHAESLPVDSRMFDPIIADVAGRYRVDRTLVKAVIRAESAFQPQAVSPKGARGLMQLMPYTALMHGVRNVHEPSQNIEGGVQHLRMLLDRYSGNVVLALAAYNAGEGAVDQYGGVPPFQETREYVWRVLQFRQHYLQQAITQVR